jgi:hypothetical protein
MRPPSKPIMITASSASRGLSSRSSQLIFVGQRNRLRRIAFKANPAAAPRHIPVNSRS